jgi:subfamily B ATP-binding cassette protein MsbA
MKPHPHWIRKVRNLFRSFENMMQNRTSIVIAHRLSTNSKSDVIVVMKRRIVEQGNHEELIALQSV